ncbi:HipA domain-containing protein [Sphingobacterium faecale]|uniref:HipA-like C-terminal domain-containing protein n=1 Tax=Sphingobacterium faecale TaxID=2803775 RepID=A0ABS1R7Y8_9SPHI|nr:hypothetical protein [Sphingobacterium faecale]MBL1410410.1 hypothetical protein [Sphingobacterium faecale]
MDVKFIDASSWQETFWFQSGGTREKHILQDENDDLWFFKRSERKAGKNNQEKYYKDEFWSEIIAYQIGTLLKLNVLRYDVATSKGEIGCISRSMIKRDNEQLVEVGRYMVTFNPQFIPEKNETRNEYTYQLLENTLQHFALGKYKRDFIQTLIFDALIGNSDRHQENWAFISDSFNSEEDVDIEPMLARIQKEGDFKYNEALINREFELRKLNIREMAPIYDSGSSLGRELTEDKINKMLKDNQMMEAYIRRGTSELHGGDKRKIQHFDLIRQFKQSVDKDEFERTTVFLNNWDLQKVDEIINNIDNVLPEKHSFYKLSASRKELILKLLTLRYKTITTIINE